MLRSHGNICKNRRFQIERIRHSIDARNCSVKRHAKIGPIIRCLGSYSFIICPQPGVRTIQSSWPLLHSLTGGLRTGGLPTYREKINEQCGEANMVAAIFREPQYLLFEPSFGETIDERRFLPNLLDFCERSSIRRPQKW